MNKSCDFGHSSKTWNLAVIRDVLRERLEWKVKIALLGTIGESGWGEGRGKKNICVTEIVEWFETSLYSQRCSSRSVKLRGHCTRTMCIPYVGNYWNNGEYSLARSINATMVSTAMIKFYEIALSNSKWGRKSVVEKWLKDRIKF